MRRKKKRRDSDERIESQAAKHREKLRKAEAEKKKDSAQVAPQPSSYYPKTPGYQYQNYTQNAPIYSRNLYSPYYQPNNSENRIGYSYYNLWQASYAEEIQEQRNLAAKKAADEEERKKQELYSLTIQTMTVIHNALLNHAVNGEQKELLTLIQNSKIDLLDPWGKFYDIENPKKEGKDIVDIIMMQEKFSPEDKLCILENLQKAFHFQYGSLIDIKLQSTYREEILSNKFPMNEFIFSIFQSNNDSIDLWNKCFSIQAYTDKLMTRHLSGFLYKNENTFLKFCVAWLLAIRDPQEVEQISQKIILKLSDKKENINKIKEFKLLINQTAEIVLLTLLFSESSLKNKEYKPEKFLKKFHPFFSCFSAEISGYSVYQHFLKDKKHQNSLNELKEKLKKLNDELMKKSISLPLGEDGLLKTVSIIKANQAKVAGATELESKTLNSSFTKILAP